MKGRPSLPWLLLPALLLSLGALPAGPPRGDLDEASYDAVILEESLEVEIRSGKEASVRFHSRKKILTPRGAERYATESVFYAPGVEIKRLRAQLYTAEGRMVKVRGGDIFDAAAFAGFELYSEHRSRSFTFRGIAPGTVIEHEYELQVSNLHYLVDRFFLQDVIPIRSRTLTVRSPEGFPLRIAVHGSPSGYTERLEGGDAVRHWSAVNVPAIDGYPDMPPVEELLPRVTFEPGQIFWDTIPIDSTSWSGIAGFYHTLARDRMEPAPAVAEKARMLTAGVSDPGEKLRRIFEFVRSGVNYVAISIDIGGWQPHANGDVLENLYGDCKDKSTLTIAMLRAVGLDGLPALLLTRDAGLIDADIPSLTFNHAIVAIPAESGYMFLDPTAESVPFGDLPWSDQGVMALVVHGDGRGELIETPLTAAAHNRRLVHFEGTVDSGGNLFGELIMDVSGQERSVLYGLLQDESRKIEDRLTSFVAGVVPGSTVGDPRIVKPSRWDEPVRVTAHISIPRYVAKAGSVEVMPPSPVRLPRLTSVASLSERSLPVFFEYPFSEEIVSRLWLPDGRDLGDLPEGRASSEQGLETSITYEPEEEGGRKALVCRRRVSVGRRQYSAEEYPSLRAFVGRLQEDEARAVTLRRSW